MYKTIILPVVLYGCETWTPTSREEHELRVLEKGKIFDPKRDGVAGVERRRKSVLTSSAAAVAQTV
jgi:hypothetical protein